MQTNFSLAQLADPDMAASEKVLRACVHCGFCTATCPTYVLLGDELDSPRGRIYLMKNMLEAGKPATEEVVRHVDRCLSCLACMTTCPSGVHYMHLVDHGRAYIERTYRRPLADRLLRSLLAKTLPYPGRFRAALRAGRLARPLAPLLKALPGPFRRIGAMLGLAPASLPPAAAGPGTVFPVAGARRLRVALLTGCAQSVLRPGINEAAIRLLNRFGVEVVLPAGEGCCGSLVHHMGRADEAHAFARANIDAWLAEIDRGLDAVVVTASGCGTTIKDYGFMFRADAAYADKAAKVSAIACDIVELLDRIGLPELSGKGTAIAYHSACSMQHGQQITTLPKRLLQRAGFTVREPAEGHLCCGSAGTYNILQPDIAARLRDRKVANIEATGAALVVTGNIGCIAQIATGTGLPIVHTVELLDWAYGGPRPAEIAPALAVAAE